MPRPKKKTTTDHEYTFDVKFFASITVTAPTVKEGRKKLKELLDQAVLDLGKSKGKRLTVGVDVEGSHDLMEIDGNDAAEASEDEE